MKPPTPLAWAARTMERAVGPHATVVLEEPASGATGPGLRASLRLPGQRSAKRLHLVPWEGTGDLVVAPDAVFVLPRVSKRVVQKLRAAGVNFIDPHRGWVRIQLPGLFIDRMGVPTPKPKRSARPLANPYGDRASLVCRVLGAEPGRVWGTRELADAAGVSTMTASHVVRQLKRAHVVFVERAGRAMRVSLEGLEPLVANWALHYDWNANRLTTYAAPMGDRQRFLRRLPRVLQRHRWALTLHAAAALTAPLVPPSKVHLYVDLHETERLHALARAAGWVDVPDGRLVIAQPYYKESVWHGLRTIDDLPVVSELQLILDLWDYPDRGREQALRLLQRPDLKRSDAAR